MLNHTAPSGGKRAVVFVVGMFSLLLSMLLVVPAVVNVIVGEDWYCFVVSALVAGAFGAGCVLLGKLSAGRPEAVSVTCSVWIVLSILSALPFVLSSTTRLSYVDAIFESMSGITTTGATVLCNLQEKSRGILLWRVMLNAIGGLGIIAIGIFVFSWLKKVSGLEKLYSLESSDKYKRFRFGTFKTVLYVVLVYLALIVLCAVSYKIAGMSTFDAICHALSTVSTGGFSNYDDSLEHFHSIHIEAVAMVFMLLASCPFVVYIRGILMGQLLGKQFFLMLAVIFVCAVLGSVKLYFDNVFSEDKLLNSVRCALFFLISMGTSTGFVTCDYSQWSFLPTLGTVLMICGGCAGSANGGLKIYRIFILIKGSYKHMRGTLFDGECQIDVDLLAEIGVFFFLYVLVLCLFVLLVSFSGESMVTAFTAVAATLSNTGPGVGDVVGPSGDYSTLSAMVKLALVTLMLAGRLDLMPVLTFLFPVLCDQGQRSLRVRDSMKRLDIFQ